MGGELGSAATRQDGASLLWYGRGAVSDTSSPEPTSSRALSPDVLDWAPVLRRLGVAPRDAARAARQAQHNGTTLQVELVAASVVTEDDLYRAIAIELALPFLGAIDPSRLVLGASEAMTLLGSATRVQQLRYVDGDIGAFLVAPERFSLGDLREWVTRIPQGRLRIVTPSAYRQALARRARPRLIETARDGLFVSAPQMSARFVANFWQGTVMGALLVALPVALLAAPGTTLLMIHLVATVFFLGCVGLRLAALFQPADLPDVPAGPFDAERAPTYTVLVALYREAEIVPELLVSLGRLVWPRSKLQVRIVCEADDRPTIEAIRAHRLRRWIELVEVPAGMPRTKPNALAYALPQTTGELVVLYDAEDRPHPMQLVEAWRRFDAETSELACLQAPIDIDNSASALLSRLFAAEYAALFRGLLPWLAQRRLMLPLGGTSNHFRRYALEDVGGWDPYNVTEDADLGTRLARFGYRTDVISLPTVEDAPDEPLVWLRQRTRWFKGWGATWLVHMRSPVRLLEQLGPGSFLAVQILFLGMLVSALVHPLLLVTFGWLLGLLLAGGTLSQGAALLLVLDAANIVLAYTAFLLLAWRSTPPARRGGFWKAVLFLPAYWLLMSAAAWRAAWQLYAEPHRWEKTPHRRRGSIDATRTAEHAAGALAMARMRR